MSVPKHAFTSTTIAEAPSVSSSAATPCGAVISDQNADRPPEVERATSAARGSSTSTER